MSEKCLSYLFMNAETPLVSIIMPAYNSAAYLSSAITSVLQQRYQHWELLIVDDASKDETAAIATTFTVKDKRISLFKHKQNKGVAEARNLALKKASGQFIAFLDSDDVWYPEKLVLQIQFMQSENATICYTNYRRIDQEGKSLGRVQAPKILRYADLLKSNFIGNLTAIYNADVLGVQYFENIKHEDYVAWLTLLKKAGSAQLVDEVLADYRVHKGSTSANKLTTISWQWHIYRHSQNLSRFKSSYLMLFYLFHALRKRS